MCLARFFTFGLYVGSMMVNYINKRVKLQNLKPGCLVEYTSFIMIFCDYGIVLNRRQLRENDRIVTVFTEAGGKVEVNFKSVRLARGKLRALSEPLSWGDFRFYLKKGSSFPVCTGGTSLSVFPGLRNDFGRLCLALHYCEIVNRLTPAQQPAPDKYALLLGALHDLDTLGGGPWLRQAFTLRVLELAGFGFRETATGTEAALWDTLHAGTWAQVRELPGNKEVSGFVDGLFARFFGEHMGIELRTLPFVR